MDRPSGPLLLGRYRLGERLGSGGAATVYRGEDLRLGRAVAVKILRPDLGDDPTAVARLEREARVAASVVHANVVAVFDWSAGVEEERVGETSSDRPARIGSPGHGRQEIGPVFVVYELVEAGTLSDLVRRRGPLPPGEAVDLVRQVLDGLAAAHRAGVVHRDLKPHNVLLTRDGQAKLTDFGIALAPGEPGLTQTGFAVGTPGYIAPELLRGAPPTPASDVYSAGVLLYELLAGEPPVPDDLANGRARTQLPPGVERVILRALAASPRDRWTDAGAMSAALAAYSDSSDRQTARVPLRNGRLGPVSEIARRAWRRVRRARGTSIVLTLGVAVGIGLLGLATLSLSADRGDRAGSPSPTLPGAGSPLEQAIGPGALPASLTPTTILGRSANPPGRQTPGSISSASPGPTLTPVPGAPSGFTLTPVASPAAARSPGPSGTPPLGVPAATATATPLPTATPSATQTAAPSATPSATPTVPTRTPTATATSTPTPTPSATLVPTATPTPPAFTVQLTLPPLGVAEQRIAGPLRSGQSVVGTLTVEGGRNDIRLSVVASDGRAVFGPDTVASPYRFAWRATRPSPWRVIVDNRFSLVTSKQVTLSYQVLGP